MNTQDERFEEVFKKSIQTMHDINAKQFGASMANMMLPALEQMKPVFKIIYEQGLDDGCKKIEGCVVVQPQGLVLTCAELLEALEFGAPDLKIEQTEYSEEQMSTEIAIVHRETGYGGSGLYAYCVECPEEGVIKLGDVEAARGGNE